MKGKRFGGPALALGATVLFTTPSRAQDAPAPAPAPSAAPAPAGLEYSLAPGGIRLTDSAGEREVPIPDCEPKALAREGDRVVVACGASGIVVLDATDPAHPTLAARAPTDGDAVGLHVVDGKVWVQITHVDARPAAAILRAARGATSAEPAPSPLPSTPRVPRQEPTEGATPAKPSSPSLVAPPRKGDLWEAHLDARAFLPIGNIGFGLLGSGAIVHRFEAPVAVYVEGKPLGVAGGKQGTIGSAAVHGLVALDTHLFELGLGFGGATINDPSGTAMSSISLAQTARIGARDGLGIFYRSNVIVDNDKFELGSMVINLQIPLASRWWLLAGGGGGPIGFAQGDVGIKYLVSGDLGPGSFLLTGTLGGVSVFKSTRKTVNTGFGDYLTTDKSASYAGPALGVGLEWRF